MMKQDQIKVVCRSGPIRETDFCDVVGIVFWNNKLGAMQQVSVESIREKFEAPVMRDDPVRDALQMTIEVMAKCIGEQKKMIAALQKDTDERIMERLGHEYKEIKLKNEIRQLKENIHSLQRIPCSVETIIDGLTLSVKSHMTYRANLESGIRKILSKEEADRLIRSAHEN